MSYSSYATIMLAAGLGIPVMAALNALLGKLISNPAGAVIILLLVALSAAAVTLISTGGASLAAVVSAPKYLFLGGLFVAFYMLSITAISPHFEVGNAVFFVLLGQLISAAAIDHFALFSADESPVTLLRAAGIAVMALGVWLTQQA